jgi:hypothetical protein
MKKLLLIAAAGLIVVSAAMADNPCPPPPTSGTNNLVSLGYMNADGTSNGFTCHIDSLDFSGFHMTSASIAPNSIVVTPITTFLDEGFMFSGIPMLVNNMSTPPGPPATEDATIFYNVTDLAGPLIHDIGILFNGNASGTGAAEFTEGWTCASPCTSGTLGVFVPPNTNTMNGTILTGLTSSLAISKDFQVSTGANGEAAISLIQNTYSQVPEPRLMSLLTLALLGGLGISKKFKSVRS